MGFARVWTDEETRRLIELYPDHDQNELSRLLGRPVAGVKAKARDLKLRKDPEHLAEVLRRAGEIATEMRAARALQRIARRYPDTKPLPPDPPDPLRRLPSIWAWGEKCAASHQQQ